ncbi:hypothetical protein BDV11DRAFT_209537 [Aspergillus similis]
MPLNVLVVGAGLGGLGAAIALNRAGHDVLVLPILHEVGAAIHVAPNASRILQSWGNAIRVWDAQGNFISTTAAARDDQEHLNISDAWLLTHRVDLHNALRAAAAKEVNGRRDAEAGAVTLEDGSVLTGHLVIGADGMHAVKNRQAVTGTDQNKHTTGQSCFRRLISVSELRKNAFLHPFLKKKRAGRDACLRQLRPTADHVMPCGCCRQAENVKLWSLASRQPPPTFVKGRLALLGTLPMRPFHNQGGAQSIENGAALGALFATDTTPAQVHQQLELYNKTRYDHSITVMLMSQTPNERRAEMLDELRRYVPDAQIPTDMIAFTWSSGPAAKAQDLVTRLPEHTGTRL